MSVPADNIFPGQSSAVARTFQLCGHVQGVGFRPFVYQLARQLQLAGWIENQNGQVAIHAQGSQACLDTFQQQLVTTAPATASPVLLAVADAIVGDWQDFTIRASNDNSITDIHIVADLALCDACRRELHDKADRRYHYPFINCSQCGPRYTIIRQLPYDRKNTTMQAFPLCEDCAAEYRNVDDRRFHAEPVACTTCGPQLTYTHAGNPQAQPAAAIHDCVTAIKAGSIIAVKGIGGYHLLCDARSEVAVATLRQRKGRPDKPLAVMLPINRLDAYARLTAQQHEVLHSRNLPVLLVEKTRLTGTEMAAAIAPGLDEVGIMLPYSPLHELLLEQCGFPLVATSANLSGEPVLTDNDEVEQRLGHVADGFLHHNRPIQRPADDPVYRIIQQAPRPLRLGRGTAPLELPLPNRIATPVLATGGHMRNTVALAWDDRIVISPHIADLSSPRSQKIFEQVITDLQQLYQVKAEQLVCDAHPAYASSQWARRFAKQAGMPAKPIYHHHAHAGVVCGEYPDVNRWLVFTWDGVGLGPDHTLWGGEALLGRAGQWQHVGSLKPFRLPGGDKVAQQPWRTAHALHWQTHTTWQAAQDDTDLLYRAWQQQLNSPLSTAAGRLFDAAAAMLGLVHDCSFEGQAPMWLEALAGATPATPVELPVEKDAAALLRIDWSPLLGMLTRPDLSTAERAACLHDSLAHALLNQARLLREEYGDVVVGLSGGVFQNKRLTETAFELLQANGFEVHLPAQLPVNDGGLCYGQVIEAIQQLKH